MVPFIADLWWYFVVYYLASGIVLVHRVTIIRTPFYAITHCSLYTLLEWTLYIHRHRLSSTRFFLLSLPSRVDWFEFGSASRSPSPRRRPPAPSRTSLDIARP